MKKYLLLIILTILGIRMALFIPDIAETFTPKVEVTKILTDDIETSVVCNGKIENTDQKEVTADLPLVPLKISAKSGDQVSAGDVLFTVDREATVKSISELARAASGTSAEALGYSADSIPETVTAPVDGTVSSVSAEEGKPCAPKQTVAVISGGNGLQVRANLSENVISAVRVGQRVVITGNGFKGAEYPGRVISLAPAAKQVITGTTYETVVEGIFSIDQPNENLRPGYSVKATVITDEKSDAVLLPYEALGQDDDNRKFVYLVRNGWAYKKLVGTGIESQKGVEITGGIEPGSHVVVDPQQLSGNYVRVISRERSDS